MFLTNIRPMGGPTTTFRIENGRIAAIGEPASGDVIDGDVIDGGGRLALPGLIEAHTHLDKTLLGMSWYRNEVGPRLIDRIDNERAERRALPIDPRGSPR